MLTQYDMVRLFMDFVNVKFNEPKYDCHKFYAYASLAIFEMASYEPDFILNKSIMSLMTKYINIYCITHVSASVYVKYTPIQRYLLPKHGIDKLPAAGYGEFADIIKLLDPEHC